MKARKKRIGKSRLDSSIMYRVTYYVRYLSVYAIFDLRAVRTRRRTRGLDFSEDILRGARFKIEFFPGKDNTLL